MDREIRNALVAAAAALLGRQLNEREQQSLIDAYEQETGTPRERATRALAKTLGLTPHQIREHRASDDNADRVFRDLEDILDQ